MATKKTMRKRGRPSSYSQKVANEVCRLICEGMSLRRIARKAEMPTKSTLCKWLAEKPKFSDQYAQAARTRALVCADDILDIADSKQKPAVKRVRIDARKWQAARMQPKLYGDKVEVEHSGEMSTFIQLSDIRNEPPQPADGGEAVE